VQDLVKLLAKLILPFECVSMNYAMMKMYLPIIIINSNVEEEKASADYYYLF
jgi:hypothetical protein